MTFCFNTLIPVLTTSTCVGEAGWLIRGSAWPYRLFLARSRPVERPSTEALFAGQKKQGAVCSSPLAPALAMGALPQSGARSRNTEPALTATRRPQRGMNSPPSEPPPHRNSPRNPQARVGFKMPQSSVLHFLLGLSAWAQVKGQQKNDARRCLVKRTWILLIPVL